MIYLDTSFIVPYYLNEASSEAVAATLQATSAGQLAVSDWTLAEFASMLARRVRMKDIVQQHAEDTMRLFAQDAQDAMLVIEPVRADFTLARNLLLKVPDLGLRTPDALHLAIAVNRGLALYTLDRTLFDAAAALGFDATDADIVEGDI